MVRIKRKGLNVTFEVTPHHLFMNDTIMDGLDPSFRTVKPNINSEIDRKALWDNMILLIVLTDHAPHLKSEKQSCGCQDLLV